MSYMLNWRRLASLSFTPPFDGPFGRTFVFADPDGYRLTANENPWDRFPLGGMHLSENKLFSSGVSHKE